jgi:hypothetical protein
VGSTPLIINQYNHFLTRYQHAPLSKLTHAHTERPEGPHRGKSRRSSSKVSKMDPESPFRLVETAFATYLVIPIKTNQGRCFFCTRGARHGHRRGRRGGRGRRFLGCRGPRFPPPRRASPAASTNRSSTPPYTAGLASRSPSSAA